MYRKYVRAHCRYMAQIYGDNVHATVVTSYQTKVQANNNTCGHRYTIICSTADEEEHSIMQNPTQRATKPISKKHSIYSCVLRVTMYTSSIRLAGQHGKHARNARVPYTQKDCKTAPACTRAELHAKHVLNDLVNSFLVPLGLRAALADAARCRHALHMLPRLALLHVCVIAQIARNARVPQVVLLGICRHVCAYLLYKELDERLYLCVSSKR